MCLVAQNDSNGAGIRANSTPGDDVLAIGGPGGRVIWLGDGDGEGGGGEGEESEDGAHIEGLKEN